MRRYLVEGTCGGLPVRTWIEAATINEAMRKAADICYFDYGSAVCIYAI